MSARPTPLALVADIGGTNARFALADLDASCPVLSEQHTLCTADFASLQHAAEHYLTLVGVAPARAGIAVACPVGGDEVRLTNRAWSFSQAELRAALGLRTLKVCNDFGGVARALPSLRSGGWISLHGTGPEPLQGPVSVLGPGTGLGVALLLGNAERGWQVIETEGGHVSFAAQGEEEIAISRWVSARFGRASNERLLSGKGLSHIDAVLRGLRTRGEASQDVALREPAPIVAAALEGHDLDARRALARFCAILGSVAGDAALIHGARTVAIAGGIVPRFIPFLRSSAFRERFLAKGRFAAWLESVPILAVTDPHPGLLGAALTLRDHLAEGNE